MEENENKQRTVHATDAEWQKIKAAAKKEKRTVSAYVVHHALQAIQA